MAENDSPTNEATGRLNVRRPAPVAVPVRLHHQVAHSPESPSTVSSPDSPDSMVPESPSRIVVRNTFIDVCDSNTSGSQEPGSPARGNSAPASPTAREEPWGASAFEGSLGDPSDPSTSQGHARNKIEDSGFGDFSYSNQERWLRDLGSPKKVSARPTRERKTKNVGADAEGQSSMRLGDLLKLGIPGQPVDKVEEEPMGPPPDMRGDARMPSGWPGGFRSPLPGQPLLPPHMEARGPRGMPGPPQDLEGMGLAGQIPGLMPPTYDAGSRIPPHQDAGSRIPPQMMYGLDPNLANPGMDWRGLQYSQPPAANFPGGLISAGGMLLAQGLTALQQQQLQLAQQQEQLDRLRQQLDPQTLQQMQAAAGIQGDPYAQYGGCGPDVGKGARNVRKGHGNDRGKGAGRGKKGQEDDGRRLKEVAGLDADKEKNKVPLSGGGPKRTDYIKKFSNETPGPVTQPITTMMLKNIPCRKSQEEVMLTIDEDGFRGKYDFFYLPRDVKFRANLGYAFINFITPEDAAAFQNKMDGYQFPNSGSAKACIVVPAHVQGALNNLQAFKRTEVMRSNRKPYFSNVVAL